MLVRTPYVGSVLQRHPQAPHCCLVDLEKNAYVADFWCVSLRCIDPSSDAKDQNCKRPHFAKSKDLAPRKLPKTDLSGMAADAAASPASRHLPAPCTVKKLHVVNSPGSTDRSGNSAASVVDRRCNETVDRETPYAPKTLSTLNISEASHLSAQVAELRAIIISDANERAALTTMVRAVCDQIDRANEQQSTLWHTELSSLRTTFEQVTSSFEQKVEDIKLSMQRQVDEAIGRAEAAERTLNRVQRAMLDGDAGGA